MRVTAAFLGLMIILSGFIIPSKAIALTINPARLSISLDAGGTQVVTVVVRNDSAQTKSYKLSVMGVTEDSNGHPIFNNNIEEAEKWVTPDNPVIKIAAKKTGPAYFTVMVPGIAAPGVGHYVGLAITEIDSNTTAAISGRLISLLEIKIAGTVYESGFLNNWEANKFVNTSPAWPVTFSFYNAGKALVPISGQAQVINFWGTPVNSVNAPLGSAVLPGTNRNIVVPLNFSAAHFWPGLYEVKLALTYGYTKQVLTKSAWVLYLPLYSQIILAIFVVAAAFLAVRLIKRRAGSSLHL